MNKITEGLEDAIAEGDKSRARETVVKVDILSELREPRQRVSEYSSTVFSLAAREIERLRNPWQPIETAPRDGTWFLASNSYGDWRRISWGRNAEGQEGWCAVNNWWCPLENKFSHWKHEPEPPESTS